MAHHSFRLSTISRALRAARDADVPIDRVEISTTGSVFLHMAKQAQANALAGREPAAQPAEEAGR